MTKKEKKAKPKFKSNQIEDLILKGPDSNSKLVMVDRDPQFADEKHKDVVYSAVVRRVDNTMAIYVCLEVAPNVYAWHLDKDNIKVDKASATAAYDVLQWSYFHKESAKASRTRTRTFDRERLRHNVRYFYDLQKLRIQSGNRDSAQAMPAVLDDDDKAYFGLQSRGLETLEKSVLVEIEEELKGVPLYEKWLKAQKGIGPTMAGVILAEIDITRAETVSALWAYTGLSVNTETGECIRRQKGVKSNWNPFLKAKMVYVMGGCLIKASSPWREHYDNYKNRKGNEVVRECMLCHGTNKVMVSEAEPDRKPDDTSKKSKMEVDCYNCEGKKTDIPWGKGAAHLHAAANRYMVKMFLQELWLKWRELEGLPITEPYAVAKLGRKHGDHAPAGRDAHFDFLRQMQQALAANGASQQSAAI